MSAGGVARRWCLAALVASIGCQFEHGTVPASMASDAASELCPGYGATSPGGSQYRLGTESLTWLEAEARCEMDGSTTHLAVIGDAAEREAVLIVATDNAWIGASDRVVEMTWRDVTGGVTTFAPWVGNEPSSGAAEDCALLIAKGPARGGYDAKNCPEKHLYVCECDGQIADAAGY